ncbi:hypothetical protein P7C70_g6156, partial [Phenoliferia sp. Uapishka_3]
MSTISDWRLGIPPPASLSAETEPLFSPSPSHRSNSTTVHQRRAPNAKSQPSNTTPSPSERATVAATARSAGGSDGGVTLNKLPLLALLVMVIGLWIAYQSATERAGEMFSRAQAQAFEWSELHRQQLVSFETLRTQHENKIEKLEQQRLAAIETLRTQPKSAVEELEQRHLRETETLRSQHKSTLEQLERTATLLDKAEAEHKERRTARLESNVVEIAKRLGTEGFVFTSCIL